MPTVMQWVNRLAGQIEKQKRYADPFEKRYRNEWTLPFIEAEFREVYGDRVDQVMYQSQITAPRGGAGAIVVDALTERLTVLGGRSDDAEVSRIIAEAWEDNDLDVMHREAHREAFIKSRSFGQVTRDSTGSKAIVSVEAADQCAAHRMPGPPYAIDAFLKVWRDEWTNERHGALRLPGREITLREDAATHPDPEGSPDSSRWVVTGEAVGPDELMVVEFATQSRLLTEPASELERIVTNVDIVDLIDGLMVFAGHFGAVPIRYGTGLQVPMDPKDPTKPLLDKDGKPQLGFKPRADHFWGSTGSDAEFGQLLPAGLGSFIEWSNHATARIRAQTSIASTYFNLDLKSHMSAELLKTDEAPMVRRLEGIGENGPFGQAWRKLMRFVLEVEAPGARARVHPRWADPQTRVEAQDADNFAKIMATGRLGAAVTAEQTLGWSPDQIARAIEEADAAAMSNEDRMFSQIVKDASVAAVSGA